MIIVEGPDGAGKSTLCQQLMNSGLVNKTLDSPRIAGKGNVERMKYETDRYLRLYADDPAVVVDRMIFSEMAYGPVLRGGSVFTMAEYLNYLLQIQNSKSFVIFCLPFKLNYKKDENPVVIEKMPFIRPIYDKMFEDFSSIYFRCVKYQWDKLGEFHQLVKFIQEYK